MDKHNKMIRRLIVVYNNLNGTNPLRIKHLLSVGLSASVCYKVILLLVKENIAREDEKGGYRIDWEKFKFYITELLG